MVDLGEGLGRTAGADGGGGGHYFWQKRSILKMKQQLHDKENSEKI